MGVLPAMWKFKGELEKDDLALEKSLAYAKDRLNQEGKEHQAQKLELSRVSLQGDRKRCLRQQLYVQGGMPSRFCFLERHWQNKGDTEYRLWSNPNGLEGFTAEDLIQRVSPIAPTEKGIPMYAVKTHISTQEQLDKVVYELIKGE